MTIAHPPSRVLALLTLAAALSACGGDGGDATGTDASNGAAAPAADGASAGSASGGSTNAPGAAGATGSTGSASGTNPSSGGGTTTAGSSGATGSAGGGSSGGGTAAIPAAGTLQTSILPTSYPSGSQGGPTLAAINSARKEAGAGLLNQSTQLDVAAAAHATYLETNMGTSGHDEDPSRINFFAPAPASRIVKAGFAAGDWAEAIRNSGTLLDPNHCAEKLLNSLYDAVALLGPATHVGFGFGNNFATTPFCVSVLATPSSNLYGQFASAGSMVTYPYDGQTGVPKAFDVNAESPRPPLALFPNVVAGTTVIVNVRNADYLQLLAAGTLDVSVTQFELADQSGNRVPASVLANPSLRAGPGLTLHADPDLLTGAAVLIPLASLTGSHTYTVTFSATLKAGGPALSKTWSFTTGL
jgi:uncharacterized protein YkwD